MKLEFIEYPEYGIAHAENSTTVHRCVMCALVIRPDTGELVLLWLCGGINWTVSRSMPNYKRHRRELNDSLKDFTDR